MANLKNSISTKNAAFKNTPYRGKKDPTTSLF